MIGSICKECGVPMKKVMHFEKNDNNTFCECPKCHFRTKPKKMVFAETKEDTRGKH